MKLAGKKSKLVVAFAVLAFLATAASALPRGSVTSQENNDALPVNKPDYYSAGEVGDDSALAGSRQRRELFFFGTLATFWKELLAFLNFFDIFGIIPDPVGPPTEAPSTVPSPSPTSLANFTAPNSTAAPVPTAPTQPSQNSTQEPSVIPSQVPSQEPSLIPSQVPSLAPSNPPTLAPIGEMPEVVARINCGSFEFTQDDGTVWATDDVFNSGGNSYTNNAILDQITGTDLPKGIEPLFTSERNGKSFSYNFDVSKYPDGSTFNVTLWEAEIFFNDVGKRVFDVSIESKKLIDDLDLLQDIKAKFTAKAYTYEVIVRGGELNIEFTAEIDFAKVSGLEILYDATKDPVASIPTAAPQATTPAPVAGPPAVVARVNCGSFQFEQTDGTVWAEDTFVTGGFTFTNNTLSDQITGNNLPNGIEPLFVSEVYGTQFSYSFDVSSYPTGTIFDVTLWMAEIFHESAGKRVFSVTMEGLVVRTDLDLFADIGSRYAAKAYTFAVKVNDGLLNIVFTSSIDNAKVSGIQVLFEQR